MRPPKQGPEAIAGDVLALNRALLRAQLDPKRKPEKTEAICNHLKAVIGLLLEEREVRPTRKT